MRKGAQLRYVRQLEKPTAFRKALSISDIYIYIYMLQMLDIHQVISVFRNQAIICHVAFAGFVFGVQK